jgi:hypothetical protein
MKALFSSLIVLGYLGASTVMAQQKSNKGDIEAVVFGLLSLKHDYEMSMERKSTKMQKERIALAASELNQSKYGASIKAIKKDPDKYLAYLNKAINSNAQELIRESVNYQMVSVFDSGIPDRFVISKLDFLKAVKYSLFEEKSNELLHLWIIPGIKLKHPIPKSSQ